MNSEISTFLRSNLKEGLAKVKERNRLFFKRMYSPYDLEADINDVVDSLSEDRLAWAMQQVQRTLNDQGK